MNWDECAVMLGIDPSIPLKDLSTSEQGFMIFCGYLSGYKRETLLWIKAKIEEVLKKKVTA